AIDHLWAPSHHRVARIEDDTARVGGQLPADQMEEGGLARSVLTDETVPAGTQRQVDIREDGNGRRIGEGNGFEMHCRHGGLPLEREKRSWLSPCAAQSSPWVVPPTLTTSSLDREGIVPVEGTLSRTLLTETRTLSHPSCILLVWKASSPSSGPSRRSWQGWSWWPSVPFRCWPSSGTTCWKTTPPLSPRPPSAAPPEPSAHNLPPGTGLGCSGENGGWS